MKSDPLISTLVGVLALSALLSLGLCYLYVSDTRDLRAVQGQLNFMNGRRAAITSLVNDCLEYSKHNADIDPLLEAVGAKQKAAPAPTNKPASK
jgi:hypothetical protein